MVRKIVKSNSKPESKPTNRMNSPTSSQVVKPEAYNEEVALRQVLGETLRKPITLGTVLLGTLGAIGTILFVPGGAVTGGIVFCTGAAVGTIAWARNYFGKRDTYLQQYHERLHEQFEVARKERLKNLQTSLKTGGNQCEQGREQVDQLDESFQNIKEILTRKLFKGELMYSRYLGTAEQVYLSGLKNLEKIISIMMSIRGIDISELIHDIEELTPKQSTSKPTVAQQRKLTTLKERKKLYDDAQSEIDVLLAQNEEAITGLSQTSASIAHLDTGTSSRSVSTMDEAMELLNDFIARHGGDNTKETISLKLAAENS